MTLLDEGRFTRYEYAEIDHCCQNFSMIDSWLEAEQRQRRGKIGHAEARLVHSRNVVEVVVERLRAHETLFLHPPGMDAECDEARASLLVPY